jgi:hypothetical protein
MLSFISSYVIGCGIFGVYYGNGNNFVDYCRDFILGSVYSVILPINICDLLYEKYLTMYKKNE